ncbi:uncharacterized protein LOC105184517 isoform X3 [Harpegnathos saltator]|uniref:uncharacterized protein LOC105184517 isoform X3 n=1 Tax=Harpegnathos saltator TaxID=610380 RepID=UPI000DBED1C4|nr:uncharacterized protein LOC105184517 isoform X3 [Harpegnathos saltator]
MVQYSAVFNMAHNRHNRLVIPNILVELELESSDEDFDLIPPLPPPLLVEDNDEGGRLLEKLLQKNKFYVTYGL